MKNLGINVLTTLIVLLIVVATMLITSAISRKEGKRVQCQNMADAVGVHVVSTEDGCTFSVIDP